MYIYCNSNKEQTFVRFGKRFKHGKSINYLAMNPRIKEIYSEKLAELQYGYITEDEFNEWCVSALEDFVWESNTSCFYCDPVTYLPIANNVSQVKTLIGFIKRFEDNLPCQAFLVKGVQTGEGADQEPLVDVISEESIDYDVNDLIDVALNALSDGFMYSQKSEDYEPSDEFISLGGSAFLYKDMVFIHPKDSFIAGWEYKGDVMNKFKYEDEVEIDPDDIQAVFISAHSQYQSYDDIKDATYDWGENIYDQTYWFENKYRIAVDITRDKDIYICGSEDTIWDFLNDFAVDYEELDEVPEGLLQKYLSSKFYE